MEKAEFDKFAEEYLAMHTSNIRASGEPPEFFAEYKIKDIAKHLEGKLAFTKVLDFGGGIGNSVPYVRRYFPDAVMTCLDVSDRSLAIARERFTNEAEFISFGVIFESSAWSVLKRRGVSGCNGCCETSTTTTKERRPDAKA